MYRIVSLLVYFEKMSSEDDSSYNDARRIRFHGRTLHRGLRCCSIPFDQSIAHHLHRPRWTREGRVLSLLSHVGAYMLPEHSRCVDTCEGAQMDDDK
jgi:hypothetical protein